MPLENESEIEEFEAEEYDKLEIEDSKRKIITQPVDLAIDSIMTSINRDRLILQPNFQRQYVWPSSKASQLIESILLAIPLPIIYLAETAENDWEVVDGQQRLTSIISFVRGQFPDGKPFRLGRLNVIAHLKGRTFSELERTDQNKILNYTLRAIILKNDSHPDIKFEVFERLNCGAVQLKDAELRNCMYRGSYNDMLASLSENQFLLKVRHADKPHERMEDRQLILRFFALKRNSHLNYRGAMKQFMNREMRTYQHASPADITALKQQFESAIECAWHIFGAQAFRRWNAGNSSSESGCWETKINVALWDTILYGLAFYDKHQIIPAADAIREEFLDLMTNDLTFVDYIGRSTDKPDRLKYRANAWQERLSAVVTVSSGKRSFTRKLKETFYTMDPSCAICHQHIHALDDAEVDHIKHYWRGGATLPENARLTHRHCNRVRGAHESPLSATSQPAK